MTKHGVHGLAAALLSLVLLAGCGNDGASNPAAESSAPDPSVVAQSTPAAPQEESEKPADSETEELPEVGSYTCVIDIEEYGSITLELDGGAAPITVANFVGLVEEGFYDGLTFHRIIDGFMMQGGDPEGNGTGGSDTRINGEFTSNGVDNPLSHTRGAISMARNLQSNDSASSQFFIVHRDARSLDGDYAVFGYVTEGIEVVDAICESAVVYDNNGSVAPEDQPVIRSITIVE